jgi:hypothetical protein
LRAAAFLLGWQPTNVDTQTYIFLEDIISQSTMDSAIVDSPAYRGIIIDALKSIPTMSLVMDPDDIFGSGGVYYTDNVEKPVSIELFYADPSQGDGFQSDGAVEKHSNAAPKTSLRLEFKREFGDSVFDYPLFESAPLHADSAVDRFDRLILRGGKNQSWTSGRFKDLVTYLEDQWVRDSQLAMSGIGSHGTFVHLYINGIYWGLYNPAERPDAWFGAAYFGGDKEDHFATNFNVTEGHGGSLSGDPARFERAMYLANEHDLEDPAKYEEFKELLDLEDFIDYIILFWYCGFGDGVNNNWYGGNRNNPPGPFRFYMWDGEFIFLNTASPSGNVSAWVPHYFFDGSLAYTPIVKFWQALVEVEDFRILFYDRLYKHCFNDGVLTDDNSRARLETLAGFISDAIVGESARWGSGRTRNDHWLSAVTTLDGKMDGNVQIFMDALRGWSHPGWPDVRLYPSFDPPALNQGGGPFAEPLELLMTSSAGENSSRTDIYYTTNGSDPRMPGGLIDNINAVRYTDPVVLNFSTEIKARSLYNGSWSALHEAVFGIGPVREDLRISELMYHPARPTTAEMAAGFNKDKQFEYVELTNISLTESINLALVSFTNGIDYTFSSYTLAPGDYVVVASNPTAFAMRYPAVPSDRVLGPYLGSLDNGGERIGLQDAVAQVIHDFRYNDAWQPITDGDGFSLTVKDTANPNLALWDASSGWDASSVRGGTPGEADANY